MLSTGATPASLPQVAVPRTRRPDTIRFTTAMLFACLILQRGGLPFGGRMISMVGPVGLGLAAVFMMRGALGFNVFRLACYLFFAATALIGIAFHALVPSQYGTITDISSLAQFLLLSGFATLGFVTPLDERVFFREVNRWFGFIAVAGILQFLLQLVHLPLFSFTGIVPAPLLYEFGYNLLIPVGTADLLKSNGFFLVEPSVFSQLMALALIIELLAFRRAVWLGLFVAGLMLSFSGTGWVVLASFLVAAVLGMGWRGVMLAGATALLLGGILFAGSLLAPDVAGALRGRMNEISTPSTSGHQRFVTPYWVMEDVLAADPGAALVGLGSGVSERLTLPYEYDVNTPVKVALEYGFPALLAYVLLFVGGRKSPIQRGILVPAATTVFITGAYQQFPPMLFLILLLVSVATLSDDQRPVRQVLASR